MFYVYILKCSDDTLYTGFTVDILKRLDTHNNGLGAKYTRGRVPVELVYQEALSSKSEAMKREIAIKRLNRQAKLKLIKQSSKNINTQKYK